MMSLSGVVPTELPKASMQQTPSCHLTGDNRAWWIAASMLAALLTWVGPVCVEKALADSPCRPLRILNPAEDFLYEARPRFEFDAGATGRYRVRIESRVPEGAVIANIDTMVEAAALVSPVALTDHRAVVRVVASEWCTGPLDFATGRSFYVDVSGQCPAVDWIPERTPTGLQWPVLPHAVGYEIRVHTVPGGELEQSVVVSVPSLDVEIPVEGSLVIAIRPVCRESRGNYRYYPVP